ncbi:MAG: 30S ribosomal protein S7 [Chloroflexi bacterium]|nr:30S ribosomal protein S7 [Chloroflexota bacterium]
MRRRRAEIRLVPPDSKYNSVEVAKFINTMLMRGKKTTAQRAMYQALETVEAQSHQNALEVFSKALRNSTPLLEVRARRVGGATYQIPVEVRASRGQALARRWLLTAARSRKGRPMHERLAQELLDAAKGEGAAVKRKEDLHKMAEANRAFVHYRW